MQGVKKEQIARAKEWDLLSYLRAHEPQELKRCGGWILYRQWKSFVGNTAGLFLID